MPPSTTVFEPACQGASAPWLGSVFPPACLHCQRSESCCLQRMDGAENLLCTCTAPCSRDASPLRQCSNAAVQSLQKPCLHRENPWPKAGCPPGRLQGRHIAPHTGALADCACTFVRGLATECAVNAYSSSHADLQTPLFLSFAWCFKPAQQSCARVRTSGVSGAWCKALGPACAAHAQRQASWAGMRTGRVAPGRDPANFDTPSPSHTAAKQYTRYPGPCEKKIP